MDFRDQNKGFPKDKFLLHNVNLNLDVIAGHERFSFMDVYRHVVVIIKFTWIHLMRKRRVSNRHWEIILQGNTF